MIHLLRPDPHWEQLLGQEGLTVAIGSASSLKAGVMIVNSRPDPAERRQLLCFLEAGGGILVDTECASGFWDGIEGCRTHIRYIVPDESSLFRNVGLLDLGLPGRLPSHATHGLTDRNQPAVYAGPLGQGWCVVLPFKPAQALADRRSGTRVFAARGPRPVTERVSAVNRGDVRRLVANAIRFLLERQNLPYVHLGYTPDLGLFGFRVDTDFGPVSTVRTTLDLAAKADMAFTWFINTSAHGDLLEQLEPGLQKQDIQTHCHRHKVFTSVTENLANMRQAKDLMSRYGFSPVGAAAPYGEWNEPWDQALAELGYQYSSDFTIGYDDLPFRPIVEGRLSPVLQIPVHPIAPGSLLAARMTTGDITRYFAGYIRRQSDRGEACFLYGHPEKLAQLTEPMYRVLMYGRGQCGSTGTLTEFIRWWKVREQAIYELACDQETLTVTPQSGSVDLPLVVEFRERIARVALAENRLRLSGIDWQPVTRAVPFDQGVLAVRRGSAWRIRTRNLIRRFRRKTDPGPKE
jgi:hypothetical protein